MFSRKAGEQELCELTMKPLPAPHVPGKTEFERFDNARRQELSAPKEELLKREAREKKATERKRRPNKNS